MQIDKKHSVIIDGICIEADSRAELIQMINESPEVNCIAEEVSDGFIFTNRHGLMSVDIQEICND